MKNCKLVTNYTCIFLSLINFLLKKKKKNSNPGANVELKYLSKFMICNQLRFQIMLLIYQSGKKHQSLTSLECTSISFYREEYYFLNLAQMCMQHSLCISLDQINCSIFLLSNVLQVAFVRSMLKCIISSVLVLVIVTPCMCL